jgi:TfoX/Sxy family transcriptional regulator of competence genes
MLNRPIDPIRKKWKPAPPKAQKALEASLDGLSDVEPRTMFGYACAFANGRLFIGLHEAGLILKLPEPERNRFREITGAAIFEPFPGRPMREYVIVPEPLLKSPKKLRPWVLISLASVLALPPKPARKPRRFAPGAPGNTAAKVKPARARKR